MTPKRPWCAVVILAGLGGGWGCGGSAATTPPHASGYVEATEVRVAAAVAGRVQDVAAAEGERVAAGQTLVTLSTAEIDLAIRRARADRDQARGAAARCFGPARGRRTSSRPRPRPRPPRRTSRAAEADLNARRADETRFEQLARSATPAPRSSATMRWRGGSWPRRGSRPPPTASTPRRPPSAAWKPARAPRSCRLPRRGWPRSTPRLRRSNTTAPRRRSSRRRAASCRHASSSPASSSPPARPLMVVVDLDHAWANVYVEEPIVPSLRIGQAATVSPTPAIGCRGRSRSSRRGPSSRRATCRPPPSAPSSSTASRSPSTTDRASSSRACRSKSSWSASDGDAGS